MVEKAHHAAGPLASVRSSLLAALALTLGLHAIAPVLAPPTVASDQLADHLNALVRLEGTVVDVWPGQTVHHVTLRDHAGIAHLLLRTPPPPLGARVLVTGSAAPDPGGLVVWAEGAPAVLASPPRAPRSVAAVLEDAPELAGAQVAVHGIWEGAPGHLVHREGVLQAALAGPDPPPGEPVLAWGRLLYDGSQGRYHLEASGWRPWTPS